MSVPNYTASESDDTSTTNTRENQVTVKVVLSADPERTVQIQITVSPQGGAVPGDYSLAPTSLTFNSGETEKTITFAATHDREDDDGESVLLGFGSLPDRVSAGTTNQATVSITDDDTTPTGTNGAVTTREDRSHTFTDSNFGYADEDGDALASVKITGLPATDRGIISLDGATINTTHLPKTVTQADLTGSKLKYTPPGSETGTNYASFTFKVSDGSNDSANYTMSINVISKPAPPPTPEPTPEPTPDPTPEPNA